MNLETIKKELTAKSILFAEKEILGRPTVIGYEKKFKWSWMATQLNTFIIASDFGNNRVDIALIEHHLKASYDYAKANYTGWPKGLQSGLGVISILISTNIDEASKDYCLQLKSGKKWAAFTIPVVANPETKEVFSFEKNPIWGRIYYPHFRELINGLSR